MKHLFIGAVEIIAACFALTWFFFGSAHPCGILEARQRPYLPVCHYIAWRSISALVADKIKRFVIRGCLYGFLINARLGQGQFRSRLISYWKSCAATGCTKIALLRASHIKPWSESTNTERLDHFNGLLLIPNFDAVFDAGLITWDNSGKIKVSSTLSKADRKVLGIQPNIVIKLAAKHQGYMNYLVEKTSSSVNRSREEGSPTVRHGP